MDLPGWMSQLSAAMRRDPKKAGVLAVLTILLVVMVAKTVGTGKPTRASAATVAARKTSTSGATAGGGSSAGRQAGAGSSRHELTVRPELEQWASGPVPPISRNLFAVRFEYFPLERPKITSGAVKEQEDEGFWAKLEKSLILQADQRDKRENQIANYRAEATRLKLQSTMMGPQPKALVNGELVGEGDVVASFRVIKIEARRIMIEREGIRLEIQMN